MPKALDKYSRYEQTFFTGLLILVCIFLIATDATKRLDLLAYDAVIKSIPTETADDVVIVAIDERSLSALGQWPWRRAVHAQLLDKLTSAGASLVAFDILFSEFDARYRGDDAVFAKSIENFGSVILAMHLGTTGYQTASVVFPTPKLKEAATRLGHVHIETDHDSHARGLKLYEQASGDLWPALSLSLNLELGQLPLNHRIAPEPGRDVNTLQLVPLAGPAGTYPTFSYLDVLSGVVAAEELKDKVVLVGTNAVGLGDLIPTPLSGLSASMPGVELHANAYAAIKLGRLIQPLSSTWQGLLSFAFIMIPILLFPRLNPAWVMPSALIIVVSTGGFSWCLLAWNQTWFAPATTVAGILLAYPLWSWQRMRHLNRFFTDEINRLSRAPSLQENFSTPHSIEGLFDELVKILKPKNFLLRRGAEVLRLQGDLKDFKAAKAHGPYWIHDPHSSTAKFKKVVRGKVSEYVLSFSWHSDNYRSQIIRFLDQINFEEHLTEDLPRSYERITDRIEQIRSSIEGLQEMQNFVAQGFEQMPGGVLVADSLGSVIYGNGRARQWLRARRDRFITQSLIDLFAQADIDDEQISSLIRTVLLEGKRSRIEVRMHERDLIIQCLPFEMRSILQHDHPYGVLLSFVDVSDIREKQREKNELIDFLSHDVRSPLVSQIALLNSIVSGQRDWDKSLLFDIERHARRSLNLSDQFLQITRAEQISVDDFYEFDLLNAIENSVDSVSPQAFDKSIAINMNSEEELWVIGNAELIERAFTNLLTNSVKYSPKNSVVTIDVQREGAALMIRITDQGEGIAAEELPYIFDRFRRQRSSEIKGQKGAGLGLNFVKVVLEKHLAEIKVDSVLGKGSCFEISYPAEK